jgi:hypothetical protein
MVPSFGTYHGFLDSGLLQIGKLLKQGFPVAKLNSSLYLSHKWPQQCSVCRSGAFKFARLVSCCDVLYEKGHATHRASEKSRKEKQQSIKNYTEN